MLQIGQAAVDITPPLGTHLAGSGMGERRPAQEILDPLYAKVMVAQVKGAKLCIITRKIAKKDLIAILRYLTVRRFAPASGNLTGCGSVASRCRRRSLHSPIPQSPLSG